MRFRLREILASKKEGHPIYFRCMTAIGPCGTASSEEAAEFPTREEAGQSPAMRHALSCYEVEEVGESPARAGKGKRR